MAEYFALWTALAELAREQPDRPVPDHDLTRPLTTRAFSHYASSCLPSDAELALCAGLDAPSLQRRLTAALPGPGFLEPELLAALCDALLELPGATTLCSLRERLVRSSHADPRRALQALAFALKQGCLRRV